MRGILELEKERNKRGQIDPGIASWIALVIGLLILGPVAFKIVREIVTPTVQSFNNSNVSSMQAGAEEMNNIYNIFTTFWDGIIFFGFIIATLLLFLSAFLIDAHPFFIVFYIFILVTLLMLAPNMLHAVNNIYDSNDFAQDVSFLPMLDMLRNNFGIILMAIAGMTLIIIYAKMRYFSG